MAVQDPLIGTHLGGYLIFELVGRGGMGAVYRARDEEQQRDIALKVLPLDRLDDGREAERFQREAEVAVRFDHPNIVSVYGSGREEGYLYMAMELVEGESLRRRLRQEPKLSLDQALAVTEQVLAALQVAHEHHVIHRDIKAENVLLQEDGTAKVLDFGVAKLETGTVLTRVDEILGTVEYMAPEQILGDEIGPGVDLYAAGVLLYEMLTGTLPFTGDSPATLVYHQLNEEAKAPSFLNSAVPRPLDRLVLRLLDKLPENRYGSAADALAALQKISQRQQMFAIPGIAPEAAEREEVEEIRTRDFRPRFVGRQQELGLLRGHFDALTQGGVTVFLAGEAGIGKTRLVEELALYAERHDGRVIQGTCFFEHALGPYMPVLDALGDLFSKTENGLTDAEREELSQLLAREAPELAQVAAPGTTTARVRAGFAAVFGAEEEAEAARQRLFDTIFELLVKVAVARPLVLILEDMHWGDEGSLHLLEYLTRRAGEAPLLCVVTYRPEEMVEEEPGTQPLGKALRELDAGGLLQEISLGRLDRQAVVQLVGSLFLETDFSEDFGDFLYAQSEGNPFIAVEVLKLLRHQDVLYCESGVWSVREDFDQTVIPDRVNALIMRRIDPLDTPLRELLQIAAVIGPGFTSRVLEKAAGLSRIDLLKALFRLEKQYRLIVADGGVYDFSHAKIREVLYAEIPWELRCEYHRIVASILEELQAEGQEVEPGALGRHLYKGEEFGRALPYLEQAADQVYRLFDWRPAAVLFEQVEDACRRGGGAVESLNHALHYSGMANIYLTAYDKGLEKLTQMRDLAHSEKRPEDQAEAWKQIGRIHGQLRNFTKAVSAFDKALASLEGREAPLARGKVLIHWGIADFECGRYREAESRWREVLALVGDGAPLQRAEALNNLAVLATMRGDLEEAWELYEQVLALDEHGEPNPQTAITYYSMGMLRADQERWDEALALYNRSLEACRASRNLVHQPAIELNRSEALIGKGNLVAGREACSRALRGFRRLDDALGVADALRLFGRICRIERDWEEGRVCLEKSIELNHQFGESISLGEAFFEMGLLRRDEGETADAVEPLRQAERIFAQAGAAPDLEQVRTTLEELETE